MFAQACSQIRNSIYGIIGTTQVSDKQINCSNGTSFMIAPGIIVTAAHVTHVETNPKKPNHSIFEVIRAPDIGQQLEKAELIAEDTVRDIALLRINNPRSNDCVKLERDIVPTGTCSGSIGFPLASVKISKNGKVFHLTERFQGFNISAYYAQSDSSGKEFSIYETDALMYGGSSGCPGFIVNTNVFGMHNKSVVEGSRSGKNNSRKPQKSIETRLAISFWVPSIDIITFAEENEIAL